MLKEELELGCFLLFVLGGQRNDGIKSVKMAAKESICFTTKEEKGLGYSVVILPTPICY